MKRGNSGKKRAGTKNPRGRKSAAKTVAEYAARTPKSSRARFRELRSTIRSVMPGGTSEVISYGIPAFKKNKSIVWFAAFEKHCSLFPTAKIIADFAEELQAFSTSKGTIHFPLDKPLPIALVKRIVRARLAQIK